jgi:hypothetical protein
MLRLIQFAFLLAALLFAARVADAAELRVPTDATAGAEVAIPTSGSGDATFYLFGPGTAIKRAVKLGEDIRLTGNDLQFSGRYTALLASGDNNGSGVFFVAPAKPADIAFLARPSRVPASTRQVISGTAFVFDSNHNLVTALHSLQPVLTATVSDASCRSLRLTRATCRCALSLQRMAFWSRQTLSVTAQAILFRTEPL